MVGEEVLQLSCNSKSLQKGAGKIDTLIEKGNFEPSPHLFAALKGARRDLLALRSKHGAHTPIGHQCSTLVEQLQNYEKSENEFQRQNLRRLISRSLSVLSGLQ